MRVQEFEIEVGVAESLAAGSPEGVWADLEGLLAPGWSLREGPTPVEILVDYTHSVQSPVQLGRYVSMVSYPFFTVVEGADTEHCRVVSLLREGAGIVVSFHGSGHPKRARSFFSKVRVVK
jgi:hypothetical protein